jgi:hypothetical protein
MISVVQNDKQILVLIATVSLAATMACRPAAGADTGILSVFVHHPDSNTPLPCRAWVNVGGERLFKPLTESSTPYKKDRSFSCDGRFAIKVPTGTVEIHVERGKEYWPVNEEIIVTKDQTAHLDITLERWVNMLAEGWHSADMHCHFGIKDIGMLKQLALADDINFEPVLTLWNQREYTASDRAWPEWFKDPYVYADPAHLVTFRNQEIERIGGDPFESQGALLIHGLTRPVKMPQPDTAYPCDATLGAAAKKASPSCLIDTDKPMWAENVVGVALGLFDSMQICHNHYHRDSTIAVCCGMATDDSEEENKDWGQDEIFHRTNSTYYRFLNCGFRLAVTGGSAMGVMPVPLGYNRTYAKLDGPLTESNYLTAIRAGRTFATSGPILILTANGMDCGAKIRCSASDSKPILVKADLRSIEPIDSLELIYNGNILKTVNLKDRSFPPVLKESIVMELRPKRGGWIAARCVFRAPDGHLRQAHTSPIYFTVDGKPTASAKDAEYMIRWIDRLLEVSAGPGRYRSDKERSQVRSVFTKARHVYEAILSNPKKRL